VTTLSATAKRVLKLLQEDPSTRALRWQDGCYRVVKLGLGKPVVPVRYASSTAEALWRAGYIASGDGSMNGHTL